MPICHLIDSLLVTFLAIFRANYSPEKYWVPLKGQTTWDSFVEMYNSDVSIFAGDGRWVYIQKLLGKGQE